MQQTYIKILPQGSVSQTSSGVIFLKGKLNIGFKKTIQNSKLKTQH